MNNPLIDALVDVENEYNKARTHHRPMQSKHEGLAVLWEEFEEVKQEVFKRHPDPVALRKELIQVAAMAVAMILETVETT